MSEVSNSAEPGQIKSSWAYPNGLSEIKEGKLAATVTSGYTRTKEKIMITLIARHQVEDWDKWFALYEEQRGQLGSLGVTGEAALRSTADSNDVVVRHEFDSMEAAEAFMKQMDDPQMIEGLKAAGVKEETLTFELFHCH